MSKKIQMLIGTILGNCLVLVIFNFWPNIPVEVVQYAIGGITSAGVGGVLGQGFADGMSKGLTSSNFAKDKSTWAEVVNGANKKPQE